LLRPSGLAGLADDQICGAELKRAKRRRDDPTMQSFPGKSLWHADEEYFADGMTDELDHDAGGNTIAASDFADIGDAIQEGQKAAAEIARELGVTELLRVPCREGKAA